LPGSYTLSLPDALPICGCRSIRPLVRIAVRSLGLLGRLLRGCAGRRLLGGGLVSLILLRRSLLGGSLLRRGLLVSGVVRLLGGGLLRGGLLGSSLLRGLLLCLGGGAVLGSLVLVHGDQARQVDGLAV